MAAEPGGGGCPLLAPPWASRAGGCPCALPTVWWAAGAECEEGGADGAAAAAAAGPPQPPPGSFRGLHLLNSFTRKAEPFAPLRGNRVGVYVCGPTVYDASHLGHARNYLAFDVLRRVLSGYFGYDVLFVENVTDVDDKIILRAHAERADAATAAALAALPLLGAAAAAALGAQAEALAASRRAQPPPPLPALSAAAAALADATASALAAASSAAPSADVEAARLGALGLGGGAWDVGPAVAALTRRWEASFLADMDALGVARPDVLTRVSEYVPQIVDYVGTILRRGLAYATPDGSVYFDVDAFSAAPGRKYGKLVAAAGAGAGAGDSAAAATSPAAAAAAAAAVAALAAEAEGALSAAGPGSAAAKRGARDFVLWKAAKAGEPWWPSPWGPGRPGWHIECSAMASHVLGAAADINGGGVDLAFPHHENQVAQCEAFWGSPSWVNFFVHAGHLHIEGLKMSKSLKNFVTIRAALGRYSARTLRLLFLLQHWAAPMELTPLPGGGFAQAEPALAAERTLGEFLAAAAPALGRAPVGPGPQAWGPADEALAAAVDAAQAEVHAALCDSVDTPRALRALLGLVRAAHGARAAAAAQLRQPPGAPPPPPPRDLHVASAARLVARVLALLGVPPFPGGGGDGGGGGDAADGGCGGGGGGGDAVVGALVSFRDTVRALARALPPGCGGPLLGACDALRDSALPPLGLRVDDSPEPGGASLWKRVDPGEAARAAAAAAGAAAARAAAADAARADAARRAAERDAAAAVPPGLMFRPPHWPPPAAAAGAPAAAQQPPFSAWGDDGVPTADADGAPLPKSALKKLAKLREAQAKAHAGWLARRAAGGGGAAAGEEGGEAGAEEEGGGGGAAAQHPAAAGGD